MPVGSRVSLCGCRWFYIPQSSGIFPFPLSYILKQGQDRRKGQLERKDDKMLKNKEKAEKTELLEEIERLSELILKNEQVFNMTTDEQLIEAVIYEQKALKNRFAHLLKTAKEKGITIDYIDRLG